METKNILLPHLCQIVTILLIFQKLLKFILFSKLNRRNNLKTKEGLGGNQKPEVLLEENKGGWGVWRCFIGGKTCVYSTVQTQFFESTKVWINSLFIYISKYCTVNNIYMHSLFIQT